MMTLQKKLDAYKAAAERSRIPKEALQIMHRATDDLKKSGILDRTIRRGEKMPAFELDNQDGKKVAYHDLLGEGPLVVSFFRGLW